MLILDFIRGWWSCFTLYGGGKGSAAPPAPDYRGAAVEQAAASKELATQSTWANRPTLNTPWGQQTWSAAAGTDPSTGQPITNWTSNINLTPEQQASLDAQQRITQGRSQAAETLLPQAIGNFQQGFNWSGAPEAGSAGGPRTAAGPGNVEASQQRAYGVMSQMLEPERSQRREALDAQLLAKGVDPNSEQARRSRAELSDQFAAQDKQMMAQALAEGRSDVSTQFGMGNQSVAQQAALDAQRFTQQNQARQQYLAEEAQRRGMTLNELNALLTSQQVNMPQMPSFSQATNAQAPNFLGAAQSQGDYALGQAKLNQNSGPDIGGLVGSLGGAAISAGMF